MMKITKPHKLHKNSRGSPVHPAMKKSMHSSIRIPGSSRPPMKHPPPDMKHHGPDMLPQRKRSHSPRMHSPHRSLSRPSMHGSPDRYPLF